MYTIKEISATDTYSVRHPVLRQQKSLESCAFANDNDLSTVHFGLFDDLKLAGVASLFHQKSPLFDGNQWQLRGMAVLDAYRRKGYGEALINKVEDFAINNDCAILWFNARINAIPFYSALHYKIIGEPFEIREIGMHYTMYKRLK